MPTRDDVIKEIMYSSSKEKLQELLEAGALKRQGHTLTYPLLLAVFMHNKEAVELLLDYGEDVDGYEIGGQTALEFSVIHEEEEMLKLLLERGADVNLSSGKDHDIFRCALGFKEDSAILELLLKKGLDVHVENKYDIAYKAIGPNEKIFDLLVQNGLLLDKKHKEYKNVSTHLWLYKRTEKLKNNALIFKDYNDEKGLEPLPSLKKIFGYMGKRELFEAVQTGNLQALERVLTNEKNNMDDSLKLELLYEAIRRNQSSIVASLLKAGAPLSDSTNLDLSPLLFAIIRGREYISKMLIDRKADVNFQSKKEGVTPLLAAVINGSVQMMSDLIQAGANVNQGSLKITPLMAAIQLKRFNHFKCLLEQQVDLNQVDEKGATALMMAIENGFVAASHALIQKKDLDLNQQDDKGQTALMKALEKGANSVSKALIEAGADVLIKDKEGNDAYNIAMKGGHIKIAKMIKEKVIAILRTRKQVMPKVNKTFPIKLLSGQNLNLFGLDGTHQKD